VESDRGKDELGVDELLRGNIEEELLNLLGVKFREYNMKKLIIISRASYF
jgi:hypothetical protein